jgi:hypothetical protein
LSDVGGSAGPTLRIATIAIALVAVAVVTPWAWFGPTGTGGGSATPTTPAASSFGPAATPTDTPTPTLPADAIECLQPVGWRLVMATESADQLTRSWTVIQPATATGPDDPRLVPLLVAADNVVGLGFCADHQQLGTDPAIVASAWRRSDADGTWQPFDVAASPPDLRDGGSAVMARPAAAATWPNGSYAFRITRGFGVEWFRVDLVWPPVYILSEPIVRSGPAGPSGLPAASDSSASPAASVAAPSGSPVE